jgi:UDP-N-acetylglucosamine:LPS N-acetylglucosamine transferase
LSFKDTKNIRSYKKFIYTGNPVRDEFYKIGNTRYELPKNNNKLNILIYGGSLGASFFPVIFVKIITYFAIIK